MKRFLKRLVVLIIVLIIAIGVWVGSGVYNVAADVPHWAFTRYLIHQVQERSVDTRAADVTVPALDDPALIAEGAHHYAAMCTGCHLAPGMGETELRTGLYPRPPNLSHHAPNPAEAFWIIKHGIKMTAMPAWGKTHDDHKIWAMVAFLQKQPHMSVERYRMLAGIAPAVGAHAAAAADSGQDASAMASATSSAAPARAVSVLPAPTTSSALGAAASAPAKAGTAGRWTRRR